MFQMKVHLIIVILYVAVICNFCCTALREFRSYSTRPFCEVAQDPNYPNAYSKYQNQLTESKGRVNSNLQDFRHTCNVLGGESKCHICGNFTCGLAQCELQLQGVNISEMSVNIPTVSDTAWAVGGQYRHDYGGAAVSHFCVFTSGGSCIQPSTTHFANCSVRCFGYGFNKPANNSIAQIRTQRDVYPGMGRWPDDGEVDLWQYPRNCAQLKSRGFGECTYSGPTNDNPSYNPQGYTFTLAGSGAEGFVDGVRAAARFNGPEDVSMDEFGTLFVADTGNHAIRKVTKTGVVTTIAGRGPAHHGDQDGPCTAATFEFPKGLDVRTERVGGVNVTVILVADTGNHRIRRIDYVRATGACTVRCLTGLCGNNTLSATDSTTRAYPLTGFADGSGLEARFSAPESVAFMAGNNVVVADTGNFLLRWVNSNTGATSTLAGTVVPGERDPEGKPLAGCTPPCMVGQQGFRDGDITSAQFYNPVDVTLGPNNTVYVTDEMRLRVVELPDKITDLYTVRSLARVSTIAGTALQGHDDDVAEKSTFFYSSGVFVTADNIAYVADSASCRIRRVSPMPLVAQHVTCKTRAFDVIRPSGCTAFDQPIDAIGRKASRVEANVQYNYGEPYLTRPDQGKYIKNCVGVPPRDALDKHFISEGDNLVVDDHRAAVNEDSEQGTAIIVQCPRGCGLVHGTELAGTEWYSEGSSICRAAIHSGVISSAEGGIVQILLQRRDYLEGLGPTVPRPQEPYVLKTVSIVCTTVNATSPGQNSTTTCADVATNTTLIRTLDFTDGSVRHGLSSVNMSSTAEEVHRVFSLIPYNVSNSMVHTVAGHPSAPLQSGCGFADAQPSMLALFNGPAGVTAQRNSSLSDINLLYVADKTNNRIRALSATCTQICENGGRCVGPDVCQCAAGWAGVDCAKPVCSPNSCGLNQVCVGGAGPGVCKCKPGYSGTACDVPLCQQTCINGECAAPDTCRCDRGWFDTTCATPVCSQTCANGGNCVAPDKCKCPDEWTGSDCRTPKCKFKCLHDGYCVAPDTCACPPQYTNFDCSAPVCTQGYFQRATTGILAVPTYKNCDLQSWCNATNEFECDQTEMSYEVIRVPSGEGNSFNLTGRLTPPTQCMNVELPINFKVPFQLALSDGNNTGHLRYSNQSEYTSYDANPWRGYLNFTDNHTGPWTYKPDRQVAFVNWLNVSQGNYVCANGGNCSAPNQCICAPGWIGFDCRTPVCAQGYYKAEQTEYVSGLRSADEVFLFERFMFEPVNTTEYRAKYHMTPNQTIFANASYGRLNWNYSNPDYVTQKEYYSGPSTVIRELLHINGSRYQSFLNGSVIEQGGYRCTIRADTEWEHENFVFSHPNFYSLYMDRRQQADGNYYTDWTDMGWPPTHRKSRVLDQFAFNLSFAYTNEGYRRKGIWNTTSNAWAFGVCIIEFRRNCTDASKQLDLLTGRTDVLVQDTDRSFRPQVTYDDFRVNSRGRWKQRTGACIDEVVRGCPNNGTCIGFDSDLGVGICSCAAGWSGTDCRTPICAQDCNHHGNCTNPDVCTCERGWTGYDCLIPLCAQECQNGGLCVAPDTCQCKQWPNSFRDGRVAGGRPLFQDEKGDPLNSGWTGYDCSVPICVQAEKFALNVANSTVPGYVELHGRGADGTLACEDSAGNTLPRCPDYDETCVANLGASFQTGCGWDPYDTGCCVVSGSDVSCYVCLDEFRHATENGFFCSGEYKTTTKKLAESDELRLLGFMDKNNNIRLCGAYHAPRQHDTSLLLDDYGVDKYYVNPLYPEYSSFNYLSNLTSNRFLCNIEKFWQGDYIDDAGLADIVGAGSIYGLKARHLRVNYPNILTSATGELIRGDPIPGEGVYQCYNQGSCIGPDKCTCSDGYEGDDCNTPLCRHLQPTGAVSSCLNSGICVKKDVCNCVRAGSVLYKVHSEAARGMTGWTGTDCSMPMCVQGYFDPFCTDLAQAPGGEGCFRCSNGGNCTAPDVCTCAPGWTGYDCRTPVCEVVADPLTRTQLGTVFEDKVAGFEADPCGVVPIYGMHGWHGTKYSRGNCTQPNQCTCLCKVPYSVKGCHKTGDNCDGPWQDPMRAVRNLLVARGPEYTFGSADCAFGYEGNVDKTDRFTTCHQTVYVPTTAERDSIGLIVGFCVAAFFVFFMYQYASKRLKKRFLLAKIERRRSKRSSEESMLSGGERRSGNYSKTSM